MVGAFGMLAVVAVLFVGVPLAMLYCCHGLGAPRRRTDDTDDATDEQLERLATRLTDAEIDDALT
jgi:hypothetical protein